MESVNFDRAAGYYDATRALPEEAMADLLAALLPELAGRQPCLEIGIGTGRIALPLHEAGIALGGLDISEAMLRQLVANAGGAAPFPLLRADATRLPAADATVGSVLAVHVLHLIPGWQRAVDEAVRVLRPGGALVALFPGGDASTQRRATAAPWRAAFREACARHGVVRVPIGAHAPGQVSEYLAGRASARMLPPVRVAQAQALATAVRDLEEQRYSWTWPHSRERVRAAAADIRAWAAAEDVSLEEEHTFEATLEWWAFELPN